MSYQKEVRYTYDPERANTTGFITFANPMANKRAALSAARHDFKAYPKLQVVAVLNDKEHIIYKIKRK